jgi:hypothetical protein
VSRLAVGEVVERDAMTISSQGEFVRDRLGQLLRFALWLRAVVVCEEVRAERCLVEVRDRVYGRDRGSCRRGLPAAAPRRMWRECAAARAVVSVELSRWRSVGIAQSSLVRGFVVRVGAEVVVEGLEAVEDGGCGGEFLGAELGKFCLPALL